MDILWSGKAHLNFAEFGLTAFINKGDRVFEPRLISLQAGTMAYRKRTAWLVDMDNDGDFDVLRLLTFGGFGVVVNRGPWPLGFRTYCLPSSCNSLTDSDCLVDAFATRDRHRADFIELPSTYTGCPRSPIEVKYEPGLGPLTIHPSFDVPGSGTINCGSGGVLFDIKDGGSLTLDSLVILGTTSALTYPPRPGIQVRDEGALTMRNCSVAHANSGISPFGDLREVRVDGGFLAVTSNGSLAVADTSFRKCTSSGSGGAIAVSSGASVSVTRSSFVECAASSGVGGAVAVEFVMPAAASEVFLADVQFEANTAMYGGAIAAFDDALASPMDSDPSQLPWRPVGSATTSGGRVAMERVTFSGNAAHRGDVAYLCGATLQVMDATEGGQASHDADVDSGSITFTCVPAMVDGRALENAVALSETGWLDVAASSALRNVRSGPVYLRLANVTTPVELVSGTPASELVFEVFDAYGNPSADATVSLQVAPGSEAQLKLLGDKVLVAVSATPMGQATMAGAVLAAADADMLGETTEVLAGINLVLTGTMVESASLMATASVRLGACPRGYGVISPSPFLCGECQDGSYSPETTTESCIPYPLCPRNTHRPGKSTAFDVGPCECKPGFWSPNRRRNEVCVMCPVGGICRGSSVEAPVAAQGYFDVSNVTGVAAQLAPCPRPDSCKVNSECERGTTDFMCRKCEDGYYTNRALRCVKCPASAKLVFVVFVAGVVVVTIGFVTGVIVLAQRQNKARRELVPMSTPYGVKAAVLYVQTMAVIGGASLLNWPSPLNFTLDLFSLFNLSFSLVGAECVLDDFALTYKFSVILPGLLLAVVIAAAATARYVFRLGDVKVGQVVRRLVCVVGPMLYITSAYASLLLFDCTRLPSGEYVLDADVGQKCFDDQWFDMLPFGLFAVVAYVIGLPLFLFVILARARNSLGEPHVKAELGVLYEAYKPQFYLFEIALLGKRLALVAVAMFASRLIVWLLFFLLCLFALFGAVQLRLQPFAKASHNSVELALNGIAMFVLTVGAFFWADDFPNSLSHLLFVVMAMFALSSGVILLVRVILRDLRDIRQRSSTVDDGVVVGLLSLSGEVSLSGSLSDLSELDEEA
ncbi:uncharacterized protein AMSG_10527 [Thecamonas trahens ATCC 50062]|uniref:DUF7630 domain-containing protein n=1 Tax=Thecamonas trahens ATCC 50062 TaxID=461836 RepID=A0A0L0DTS0_THETB|nr:hypothetical protein AMSG_10527 [Thecamonas trahens ATCC 50062]KNC54873.1 hypothetical protein AMSG_10527 [Thecamonas trahens ATCC 50062]|eukprot:XP_013753469.1 hypothetical protein AMSG_10527 [Thecamonas trahens ATCC 50062]